MTPEPAKKRKVQRRKQMIRKTDEEEIDIEVMQQKIVTYGGGWSPYNDHDVVQDFSNRLNKCG